VVGAATLVGRDTAVPAQHQVRVAHASLHAGPRAAAVVAGGPGVLTGGLGARGATRVVVGARPTFHGCRGWGGWVGGQGSGVRERRGQRGPCTHGGRIVSTLDMGLVVRASKRLMVALDVALDHYGREILNILVIVCLDIVHFGDIWDTI